jgi:hypothetical protein
LKGEHVGNKGKKKKKILPPPPKTQKKKKSRHFECTLGLPIGCMKMLFPKLLVTIFGLAFLAWANTPIINWGYLFIGFLPEITRTGGSLILNSFIND